MFRTALRGLRANKLRFALTAVSVVLGVAFVAGSFVFTDTIQARFDTLFSDVYAGVDATVRSEQAAVDPDASIDEGLVETIGRVEGVEKVAGSAAGTAQIIDAAGDPIGGQGPPTLGFSWVEDPALNALRIDEGDGRPPATAGEVVIDVSTAEATGFGVGDAIEVQTMNGVEEFTLVGLASFGTEDNLAGATITAFDLSDAQRLFGLEGRLTAIDVVAADGVTQEALVERLEAAVPAGTEVLTGEQQTQEQLDSVTEGLGFLGSALLAFAGVAVLVGAFVIQNTFRITVAQRIRELALLRAVGATGGQITRVVLIEAAAIALGASAVGVVAGIGVAELIRSGMEAVGIGLPDGPLTVAPRTVVIAMAVGVVVTIASALLPARRASSISPMAALSETTNRTSRRSLRIRAIVGASLAALGTFLTAIGLVAENGASLTLVAGGAVTLFLGMSTLAPLVAAPIARALSAPFRGITARLARENIARQPRRTASTASALMIGVALVAFVSIFAASIEASVTESLEEAFPAELSAMVPQSVTGVSPVAVGELERLDEFDAVSSVRGSYFGIGSESLNVAGVDPHTVERVYDPGFSFDLSGLGEGMAVSAPVLDQRGWSIGDVVTVDYPLGGPIDTEIVGTFEDATFASFVVAEDVFIDRIDDGAIVVTLMRLADGVDLDEGLAAAESALVEFPNTEVDTQAETIAAAAEQVDQLVALFTGLLGLALMIALLGIANTLALSIVERTREIGLLRAVGMGRGQVRTMVRWEATLTAVFGALLGVAIGSVVGFGVVSSLADDGLGAFSLPGAQLAIWVAVAAVAGVVASLGPARKAARLDVLRAISHT